MENWYESLTDYFEEHLGIPKEDFPIFAGGMLCVILDILTIFILLVFRKQPLVKSFFKAVTKKVKPIFKNLKSEEEMADEESSWSQILQACLVLLLLVILLLFCLLCFWCCCRDKEKSSAETEEEMKRANLEDGDLDF